MKEKYEKIINCAIQETFKQVCWKYNNEAEFKHELYHQLASQEYSGVRLGECEKDAITPRLHSEARSENGLNKKADIILCDPYKLQDFNYRVQHAIELKMSLTAKSLSAELEKLNKYSIKFDTVWIVSQNKINIDSNAIPKTHPSTNNLHIIGPDENFNSKLNTKTEKQLITKKEALNIVKTCIKDCLHEYGNGKEQFHGFYWCNYEDELTRKHSFPCEGDFNARLYHRLRQRLLKRVRIFSEYEPHGMPRKRIDFVLVSPCGEWAIPIEIKMNWDQFKPKYKDHKLIDSEIFTILKRFEAVKEQFNATPILVVIQGKWRIYNNKRKKENRDDKREALKALKKNKFPLELYAYDELNNSIKNIWFGIPE